MYSQRYGTEVASWVIRSGFVGTPRHTAKWDVGKSRCGLTWPPSEWDIHSSKSGEQIGLSATLGSHLGVQRHLAEACIGITVCQGWWVKVRLIQ